MGQGAYIFGCEGLSLTEREQAFFRASDPWGFILFARNIETPEQVSRLTSELREAVGRDAPILIDQEGGRVQRLRAPYWREWLPPLDQCQTARDPARAMWLRGRIIAHELLSLGIDVSCAPMLDVARPETHEFLYNRCYGLDAATVIEMGRAQADGLSAGGVAGIIKHIPGHGRGTVDSHLGLPRVSASLDELSEDFAPFKALADLPMAMTAHIVYEAIDADLCATQSPTCIDLIRNEIGFDGLLMTDDVSMEALSGTIAERGLVSLRAGCDIVLHCNGDMAEMEALASLGALEPRAQQRADSAAHARGTATPVDLQALEAEFAALLP
ncbi:beta-N-acetylhexosaminidase [Celeribacter litoreus]|uniref:beta-N-acetylhexosaminidase n=1 Tax=Celeribacter litoreus TaxID=2876714 RepID=UPI001CCFA9D6|nr:beta-N-acetylhexosaminidase [Celeribacter litoreus]MCA0043677.1 beta-N-acetylhexosaminidase [Celeribacter litoreus]